MKKATQDEKKNNDEFKTIPEILEYLTASNRKISKSKLYKDISNGLLIKKKGVFKKCDVDRYGSSLAFADMPLAMAEQFEDTAIRKQDLEISILEVEAETKEMDLAIFDGTILPAAEYIQEQITRSLELKNELITTIEAKAYDICEIFNADASRKELFARTMEELIEDAFSLTARKVEYLVEFEDEDTYTVKIQAMDSETTLQSITFDYKNGYATYENNEDDAITSQLKKERI